MADPRFTLIHRADTTEPMQVALSATDLRARPSAAAPIQTELLHGQQMDVHHRERGWLYGQIKSLLGGRRRGYVGWVRAKAMTPLGPKPTHRVTARRAPVFAKPDIKSAIRLALPMNARVSAQAADDQFIQIGGGAFIHRNHLMPHRRNWAEDFVSEAERYLGAPYVWGGVGGVGVDCSGLVQMALAACGRDVPRDSDLQAKLGRSVIGEPVQRGDLVFWAGHVGIMTGRRLLLHANASHMTVTKEPLSRAVARIETPVTDIRRL